MKNSMLHIFRNSPVGRENLLQSAYFCKKHFGLSLEVYIPTVPAFTMNLGSEILSVQLDATYTRHPDSARAHAEQVLKDFGLSLCLIGAPDVEPGPTPQLSADWAIMACPRVISEQSGRVGLGHIGPKVRGLVKYAPFPVFVPALAFKAWNSVTAFFGGSPIGAIAVKEAVAIGRLCKVPIAIHTQLDDITVEECERSLQEAGILSALSSDDVSWNRYDQGDLEENLYNVPHDSLVVVGAAGHKLIKELVFGSKLEVIQSTLPNPLLVVGPECKTPWDEEKGGRVEP